MIKIKIKGVPTPYTPQHQMRQIWDRKILPLTYVELPKEGCEINCIINNRLCIISCDRYGLKVCYWIEVVDEPAPPRKPRKREQMADEVFMEFCKTREWTNLLWAWERHWGNMFRKRLISRLQGMTKTDCECCNLKFKCFTER